MATPITSKPDTLRISVWLRPEKTGRILWCMLCRDSLGIKVEGTPRVVVQSDANLAQNDSYRPLKFPIKIRCRNHHPDFGRCPALWIIQGYVDE